ncbi:MAG: DUF4926 domain-containing protein [Thermoguttaceae bacterium]|jgi:hypothetical protein|nr:DUF4926 domain-containing protein [Thermoguttaceae bacterium]
MDLSSEVALTRDLPDQRLCRGDVATVVEKLPATEASGGEEGYVLEVSNAIGETIAVVTVPVSAVQPLQASEVLTVRPFALHG